MRLQIYQVYSQTFGYISGKYPMYYLVQYLAKICYIKLDIFMIIIAIIALFFNVPHTRLGKDFVGLKSIIWAR